MPVSEAYIDFIAGWASGAVSTLIIQPVDTVLTRLQAGDRLLAATTNATTSAATATATATASSAGNGQAVANTSVRVQLRGLLESYGVSSLWRGSSAMISAVPMQNCLLMGGYGVGKQWAEAGDLDQSSTLLSVFVGGCTGGLIQSFFMSPVELIKVNQQVHGRAIAAGVGGGVGGGGGSSASVKAASLELWRGLFVTMGNTSKSASSSWRGLNATLLRDGIPHGVWFASYEWCKTTLTKNLVLVVADGGKEESSTTTTTTTTETVAIPIVSGAFAATVAWAVGYPFDIIKTRIQAASPGSSTSTQGMYMTALELIKESNGSIVQGLYRGFGLKLVRAVPASMIGFLVYEQVAGAIRSE